ncbi:DUF5979 domain-containing protein [Streptomyces sp. NPDC051940]|uniref:DUF5979 domain-containing protein n=1 Tax=Streptomyces sp. NPDC051940 TaxID=3155675 RepID=UPI0034425B4A
MYRRLMGALRLPLSAVVALGVLMGPAAGAGVPAQPEQSAVTINKTNDLGGETLKPGNEFIYEISGTCSGLTVDCVNFTVTDTLPEGLEVTSLPQTTSTRIVTYDETTRELTVLYQVPLSNPQGELGLKAGASGAIEIGMRLPTDTQLTDGTVLPNTATADADNADPQSSESDVTVEVPRVVRPNVTKTWTDGSAVAGTGEESTVTLNVTNTSSSSAEVTELSVSDQDADTFENFDFTGATVTRFPDGADTAVLVVTTSGGQTLTGDPITSPGELPLPAGVDPADVVGVEVVFSNSSGDPLPYDPTGGTVEIGLKLRDTKRSDGSPLRPTDKVTVANCATPAAVDTVQGEVTGPEGCANYDILPDILVLNGTKSFYPDTDGDFQQETGEHAVLGENSPVSAGVDVTNNSPFPVKTMTITEPDPDTTSEFTKIDVQTVRLRFPQGATSATLTVTYADSTSTSTTYTENTTVDVAKTGTTVTKVEVVYTGVDADGNPTITEDATAGLDLHGTLTDDVTADDLPSGSSPGVSNCAGFAGDAGRADGSGTAAGTACKDLPIEEPNTDGSGDKTAGQTSVPMGQPIPFDLTLTNNGNKPLVNPVISDPRTDASGAPDPAYPNPFDTLRITDVYVTPSGLDVTIELYDPDAGAWVPYDESDAALLERATGVRAGLNGDLPPQSSMTLHIVTTRRDGSPDDVTILDCFSIDAGGDYVPGDPACAPEIQTGPVDDSASLNKNITPGTLPEYVPGLPQQYADATLTIRNTGNMSAKFLEMTDNDTDFFDAVDFVSIKSDQLPKGADRVQIDAYVGGAWVDGTPATGAALPAGVSAADVQGIRVTYLSTSTDNEGYTIVPCAEDSCSGKLVFTVSPRQTLRSNGEPVPSHLEDTVSGEFLTMIQDPSTPKAIDPDSATLDLVKGDPQLAVEKTPDTALAPGEDAPFYLKVTNTGTANIPGLVVKDLLPPGIGFVDTFAGDNGEPYKIIDVQVPDGTPPVPTPVFTPTIDGSRYSALQWDFSENADGSPWVLAPGATFTIEIHVTLEAGVTAGQVITNTMGATSSDPDFDCAGTSQTDGDFGSGLYCTDPANLTAESGAAFHARKWVAGNPDLGWYNTSSEEYVPLGDSSCLQRTGPDGTTLYTHYPCIALVNPGDQYHYLMRIQNAGTEPGTNMRIVDRLPVQGDKGVVVDADRGTEWDQRPTLASEPVLTGPGTMTTSYSNEEPLCTDDLNMGGAGSGATQCPASAWDDPFGPAVLGLKMDLAFDPSMAPGDTVQITFDMDTPLDVTQVSNPTIAWNSYGHAETTDRDGSPHVLQPAEPVQVGVGLSYGSLVLQKAIGRNPAGLPLDDETFTFHATCVINPVGGDPRTVLDQDYQVSANQPVTVPGLPAGAECRVWETDAEGGTADHPESDPVVVEIDPGSEGTTVQTAEITNDFPETYITLDKQITGAAAGYAADSYPVELTCTYGGTPIEGYDPRELTLVPGNPRRIPVPAGSTCTMTETDPGGATTVVYDPAGPTSGTSGEVPSQAGDPGEITVTNDYAAGSLVVSKEATGYGAPELAQGPYEFSVDCSFNGVDHAVQETIVIPAGDGEQTSFTSDPLTGLPAGAVCTVTETGNGGADTTPPPVTVTIVADETVTAGFTGDSANPFSAGTIGLTKTLDGEGADQPYATSAVFTIRVVCEKEAEDGTRTTVFSRPVRIKGGETIDPVRHPDGDPVKIPVGSHCYGVETGDGGASAVEINADSYENGVVVRRAVNPDQPRYIDIDVVNTFDLGSIELTKELTGDAARYVGDRPFTVEVSCVLPQGGGKPTPIITGQEYTLTAGETVTIDDLPVGARCWAVETDSGGAAEVTVDHGSQPDALVVADGSTGVITVTNEFPAGELTVSKTVVNGDAGPYPFEVSCTTGDGPVDLDDADAAFDLSDGEDRTITVPLGADCTVEETDVAADDTVTYEGSDGDADGVIAVDGVASVRVTNTFPDDPGSLPDTGGSRPDRGRPLGTVLAAVAALLALSVGLTLVMARRRRSVR